VGLEKFVIVEEMDAVEVQLLFQFQRHDRAI
jgi:hypothetical protein